MSLKRRLNRLENAAGDGAKIDRAALYAEAETCDDPRRLQAIWAHLHASETPAPRARDVTLPDDPGALKALYDDLFSAID